MKIVLQSNEVLTNTDGKDSSFKIDPNDPFVFGLLRKSIYSNPLRSTIQETISNARDANREAGKKDVPVRVIINNSEGYIVVSDNGVGITPERMEEIVLWYGRSTKRGTNGQTGGFGLGFKSPLSISNSFTITTKCLGFQFEYCAYIDETSKGALRLISKTELKDNSDTGTSIRVPIGKENCNKTNEILRDISKYWSPPIHIEGQAKIESAKPLFSGTGWVVLPANNYNQPLCVCDGIPFYGTPHNDITIPKSVIPVFKTGEIQLAANRESVFWSPETIAKFKEKIHNFETEYKKHIENDLNKMTGLNHWAEKYVYLLEVQNLFRNNNIIKDLKYDKPITLDLKYETYPDNSKFYSFKYITPDSTYEKFYSPKFSISNLVKVLPSHYYDKFYVNATSIDAKSLATLIKNKGKVHIIFNDLIEETLVEYAEKSKRLEEKLKTYNVKYKDYTDTKRKTKPSRPNLHIDIPSMGILTKEMSEKTHQYIVNNELENHTVIITTFDKSTIDIPQDALLSDIKKIEIKKDTKPKEGKVKPVKIPDTSFSAYEGCYSVFEFSKLKTNPITFLYIELPTQQDLRSVLSSNSTSYRKLKTCLKSSFNTSLILITSKELAKAKSDSNSSFKTHWFEFSDWIDDLYKKNPHILYTNEEDYKCRFLNNRVFKLCKDYGTDYVKKLIDYRSHSNQTIEFKSENPKNNTTESISGGNHSLFNNILSLSKNVPKLKSVIDNLKTKEYNIEEINETLRHIFKQYPMLEYLQSYQINNIKDESKFVDYIKLVNNLIV